MAQLKQKKTTEFEEALAAEIVKLKDEIKTLPAYPKRKKDEKDWNTFFSTLVVMSVVGIGFFGLGWLAVALTGSILALVIVESGLLFSLSIGLSAWPLYNTYLWLRDLFASEEIKNQNKDYDNMQKNLKKLQELSWKKDFLSKKINNQLNQVKSLLNYSVKKDFNLKNVIQDLEAIQKKKPAYARRVQDKKNWSKVFRYSGMSSCIAVGIYFISFIFLGSMPVTLFLGPAFPAILILESIVISLFLGPVIVSSLLHATYLLGRNMFSSTKIKAENKEYDKVKKIITELKKLSEKKDKLDEKIQRKLQTSVANDSVSKDIKNSGENSFENLSKNFYENNIINYGDFFNKKSSNSSNDKTIESTKIEEPDSYMVTDDTENVTTTAARMG